MKLKLRILPAAVAGALAASMCSVVFAQQAAPAAPKAEEKVEEVIVTGTRIKSPGAVSNSPISSIAAEEIKSSQPIAVEEFIKALPSAVPAIGPGTNNGSGGGATIDLRGLGPNRTLVLLDGRRIVPFNLAGTVDTNAIPIALLQRVDLITGGASAVYGADAVSGVVNFVLRRDFKGIDVSHSYGVSGENDTKRNRTDVTVGATLDNGRGNVAMSFGLTDANALRQDARPIGAAALSSTTGAIQGSGTTIPAAFQIGAGVGITPNPLAGTTQINPATGRLVPLFNTFNFNPQNFYVTPMERFQVTAIGNYSINQYAEPYTLVTYTRADVRQQLASSGTFLNVYQVPIGNPFIPQLARDQICAARGIAAAQCVLGSNIEVPMAIGRRITEFGPRLGDFLNKSLQATAGVRGDIAAGWTYDAYWSQGESDQTRVLGNWGSLSRVQQAMRALNTTTCTANTNGCVPLNLFGNEGTITPAMVNFINLSAVQLQNVRQRVLSASVSGDLPTMIKSPFAAAPISVAFGAEDRKVTAGNFSDQASQIQGEVLGTGAPLPDRSGTFKLKELFGEVYIPLVKDAPFMRSLTIETGYRRTDFSTTASQSYNTYKYGLEWEPVKSFRVRAMEQRATRAPNINELFAPLVSGLSNLAVDPCQLALINQGQANSAGTLSNLCRLTGVPVGQIGSLPTPSAGQINNRSGGNPALGPEVADSQTVGFVWQPQFVKSLAITFDYYKIDVNKAVSSPSTTDVLDDCYSTARNPGLTFNAACSQVLRGVLGTFNGADAPGVVTPLSNLGKINTSGYDLTVSYVLPLKDLGLSAKLGRLDLSLQATQVEKWTFQPTPAAVKRDCLGFYSVACGAPLPKRKFNQRTAWTVNDFVFAYNWRYQSAVTEEPGGQVFLPAYSEIKAYSYFDLSAVWKATKNVRINLSVNNVTDKAPPNVGNTISGTGVNSGNTFPQNYDVVGRYFSVGATVKF